MARSQLLRLLGSLVSLSLVAMSFVSCGEASTAQTITPSTRTPVPPSSDCYQHFGVTLSGAEWEGTDYIRPTNDELKYYAQQGVKIIRLEIRWDRFQPNFYGSFNQSEVDWLKGFIAQAASLNMTVDVDLHERSNLDDLNFGTDLPVAALVDFWRKMATTLQETPGICGFGIANEPDHNPDFLGQWSAQANAVISALSPIDQTHFFFVPEDNWDSSHLWSASQAQQIQDTARHQVVFEAHSYWDRDESGNYMPDIPPTSSANATALVMRKLGPFIQWCHTTGNRCLVGELGVPQNFGQAPGQGWLDALNYAFEYMRQNNITGIYWAGGPGWGTTYPLSIEPVP
ncbi:MAG TPA: cellulase family glycosylhydrolase, partial [Ktedonobacteraceae bacterium]